VVAPPTPKSKSLPIPKEKQIYTLIEAINLALQFNPDILEAQKNIEEAQGGKIVARAGYIPTLTTSGTYFHRETDYATANQADPLRKTEDFNISVRMVQNIYSGQRVRGQMAIAKILEEIRLYQYQVQVDTVVMNVRLAFYDILQNRAAVEVREQAVELLKKQLEEQQNAFAAGTVGQFNVFRSEVSLANEMPALLEAQNEYATAKVRLSRLLAVPYLIQENAVPFDVEGTLNYQKVDVNLDDCLAKAETLRPEIKATVLEVERREKEIVVARSSVLPQLNLFFGYDIYNSPFENSPNSTVGGYIGGVSGSWLVFDGLAAVGRIKSAKARVGAALQLKESARLMVLQEVRTAYLQMQQAEATVASQVKNTTLARESYVLVQAGFSAGINSQLDVLQGRSDLTNAQLAQLSAQALHKSALARLQRSMSSQVRLIREDAAPSVAKIGPKVSPKISPPLSIPSTPSASVPSAPASTPHSGAATTPATTSNTPTP